MRNNIFVTAALAAAFVLPSCDNDNKMGADLIPSSDMAAVTVIDTISITACTELEGDVSTKNSNYLLVGQYNDPVFGKSSAAFAARFSNTSYGKFSNSSVCDSMILTMGFDTTMTRCYGDLETPVTIEVYPLIDSIKASVKYTQNTNLDEMAAEEYVAATTFVPAKCDTMIRFDIDVTYGQKIINAVNAVNFDNSIFGFLFKVSSGNSVAKFYRNSKHTQYTIYHRDMSQNEPKEQSVSFSIASSDYRVSVASHDYQGSKVEEALGKTDCEYLYLQSMAGTRLRIDFPKISYLNKLASPYMVINRAELICPLSDKEVSLQDDHAPLKNLVIYPYVDASKYDNTYVQAHSDLSYLAYDNIYLFPEFTTTSQGASTISYVSIDADKNQYRINLTKRIQDMVRNCPAGTEPTYSVCLYPNGRIIDFERSVVNSPINSANPMKLVVEYISFQK